MRYTAYGIYALPYTYFYGGIMKKGEIYEGVIEKVDFPNKGYVKYRWRKSNCKKWNSRSEGFAL